MSDDLHLRRESRMNLETAFSQVCMLIDTNTYLTSHTSPSFNRISAEGNSYRAVRLSLLFDTTTETDLLSPNAVLMPVAE